VSATLLPAASRAAVPWKNGGGVLHEIAASIDRPDAADAFGRYRWRVATAEIAADGPFSAFPGYDRLFAAIAGNGVGLSVTDRPQALLWPGDPPLAFPGEAATSAFLLDGPVRALNVMVRRGAAAATLARHALAAGAVFRLPPGCLAVIESGHVSVSGEASVTAGPLDAVLADPQAPAVLEGLRPGALWQIAIAAAS
jgi:hypothetical protein